MDILEISDMNKILYNMRFNTVEKIILMKKIKQRLEKKLEIIAKREKIIEFKISRNSTYMRYKRKFERYKKLVPCKKCGETSIPVKSKFILKKMYE